MIYFFTQTILIKKSYHKALSPQKIRFLILHMN